MSGALRKDPAAAWDADSKNLMTRFVEAEKEIEGLHVLVWNSGAIDIG